MHRTSGVHQPVVYATPPFFFLHTINAFEVGGHVVLDVAAYKDAKMIDCMFVESLKVSFSVIINILMCNQYVRKS